MKLLITFSFIGLVGCASATKQVAQPHTAPWITKQSVIVDQFLETTPVLWGGAIMYVDCLRGATDAQGTAIELRDANGVLQSSYAANVGFCSAFVLNSTLYVFGSTNWAHTGNSVVMYSTQDLITWSSPSLIVVADQSTTLFNTSVSTDSSGFVLAYELCQVGQVCFNFRFKHSADMVTWQDVGAQFGVGEYTACPTIRYSNGYYYAFYLAHVDGLYVTEVARSSDLIAWQTSSQAVLSPVDGGDVNGNASDFDLIEYNGQVLMNYLNGSQTNPTAVGGLRLATYNGTLAQFLEEFFQ